MTTAIPWRMRSDLVIQSHDDDRWMVKDPVSMFFTMLENAELRILQLLDGRRSVDQLLDTINADSSIDFSVSIDDLKDVIYQFAQNRLIVQTIPCDSLRLRPIQKSWGKALFSIFRIRIPILNPSRWIDPHLPWLSRWLNPQAFWLAVLWITLACGMLLLRLDQFASEVPNLFRLQGPQSLIILMAIFLVVKLLHEAGHAIAARMCQSECHECGVMLLFFTPVLYTNVSDGWTRSRRQRIIITLAGIGVELLIAATCFILWSVSLPGFARILLLNAVIVCSVNTLLFNGNPLLKFDGYFVLADVLDLPNLAARSGQVVRQTCIAFLTGRSQTTSDSRIFALHAYGWASAVYRIFLCIGLATVIQMIAATWNQQWLGQILIFVLLTGSLLFPAVQFFLHLKATVVEQTAESEVRFAKWIRPLAILGTLALLFFIPLPKSVVVPAYTEPTSSPVYTPFVGTVRLAVEYGTELKTGDVICVLENRPLDTEILRWENRQRDVQTRIAVLQNNPLTANSESLPALRDALQAAKTKLQSLAEEKQQLTVRSPNAGILLPPRQTPRQTDETLPELWDGLPLSPGNQGATLNRGTLLGYVGQVTDTRIIACVDEQTVEYLRAGQPATFYRPSSVTAASASVERVGRLPLDEVPAAMSTTGLAFGTATRTGFRPAETTYSVLLTPQQDPPTKLYSVGSARIRVAKQSLFDRIARFLRSNFG